MKEATMQIEEGACYRDPKDGEVVRVLGPADGPVWRVRVLVAPAGLTAGAECFRNLTGWRRVPDPTPAVIDDEPTHDEAARQERVDTTARLLFVAIWPNGQTFSTEGAGGADAAYRNADALEAARERYIAGRKGGVK